ncbi:hypothetical protein FRC12_009566 [Ceratobasidium sp. 428]|nr:hypothetical protein FRC12_009566 [Ceratobasidium sp. 428]
MMTESFALGSRSQRVFSVPELAIRVLDFSATQDCARLLRTCRSLHKPAIPYVWHDVDDVRHLLLLLGEAFENPLGGSKTTEPRDVWLVDTIKSNNAFTRFDVYAPHVKTLDVYGSRREHFKIVGWKVLIARARKQALLPNLHTLVTRTSCGSHGPDQLMWVEAFNSPSLINVLITPDKPGMAPTISYEAASAIMRTIEPQVSNLRNIGLFPDYRVGDHSHDGESTFLALLSGDPFYMYIRGASSLQHLSGSLGWMNEEPILILGQLPCLETITISVFDNFGLDFNFELPEDSFPSLHGLYLHGLYTSNAVQILRLKPLLKGLKSLELHMDMDEPEPEHMDYDEWLAEIFFPRLVDAPHVEKLKIDVDDDDSFPLDPYVINRPSLIILSHLPLGFLRLGNLVLNSEALQLNLNEIWPSLTQLEIPAQPVSLAGLPKFVAIPCLQHLEIQLDLQREAVAEPYGLGESSLISLVASKGGKVCSKFADVDYVTRALLSIAPHLTCITWPTPGEDASKKEVRQYECAEILNGYLSSLREINTLRSML